MSDPPTVSVILPVYNAERYLGEAVRSILAQTFTDFELLAVNDGSTDGGGEILEEFARLDPRVRVLRQENRGLVRSLNRAGCEARGRYLARMDADDVAEPSRLALQVSFLDAHPSVGVLGGAILRFHGDDRPPTLLAYPESDAQVRQALEHRCPFAHPAVMMRRDVWEAAGGYRTAFFQAEDYDLWLRMAERTVLANLPEPVLRYRVHGGQRSRKGLGHSVMCSMAARAAARARGATGKDPLDGVERIGEEHLAAMGVAAGELESQTVMTWLGEAYLAAGAGRLGEAMECVEMAAAEMRSPSVKADLGYRVSAARARMFWRARQVPRGAFFGAQAVVRRLVRRARRGAPAMSQGPG